jgi:hypothetical protein
MEAKDPRKTAVVTSAARVVIITQNYACFTAMPVLN